MNFLTVNENFSHTTTLKKLTFGINNILQDENNQQEKLNFENFPLKYSETPEQLNPPEQQYQIKAVQRVAALFAAAAAPKTSNFYQKSLNENNCIKMEKRIGHPYQSRMPPTNKKPRTSFSKSQVAILETRFLDQKYLASADRQTLANELCMSDSQVKTWFQNRRTKWR